MESSESDVACRADGPPMQSSLDDDHVQSSIPARCKSWMQPLTRGTTTKLDNVITPKHGDGWLVLCAVRAAPETAVTTIVSMLWKPGCLLGSLQEQNWCFHFTYPTVSQRTMPRQAHTVRVEMKRTCRVRSFFLSFRETQTLSQASQTLRKHQSLKWPGQRTVPSRQVTKCRSVHNHAGPN